MSDLAPSRSSSLSACITKLTQSRHAGGCQPGKPHWQLVALCASHSAAAKADCLFAGWQARRRSCSGALPGRRCVQHAPPQSSCAGPGCSRGQPGHAAAAVSGPACAGPPGLGRPAGHISSPSALRLLWAHCTTSCGGLLQAARQHGSPTQQSVPAQRLLSNRPEFAGACAAVRTVLAPSSQVSPLAVMVAHNRLGLSLARVMALALASRGVCHDHMQSVQFIDRLSVLARAATST